MDCFESKRPNYNEDYHEHIQFDEGIITVVEYSFKETWQLLEIGVN